MLGVHDGFSSSSDSAPPPTSEALPTLPSGFPARDSLFDDHAGARASPQLILVLAPAGFAKTATVTSWLTRPDHPVRAWRWLRCSTFGLQTLWQAVTAAIVPHSGVGSTPEFSSPATALRLARGLKHHLTLVIGDYQLKTSAETDLHIAELSRASPLLTLIVVSRRVVLLDGPLVSASTRVRCIDVDALRLSPSESSEFARHLGFPASAALDTALKRAAGWPLAVCAALDAGNDEHHHQNNEATPGKGDAIRRARDPRANLDAFASDSFRLLTQREQRILLSAAELDAISASQIREALGCSTIAQAEACDRLCELGLLTRIRTPGGIEYRCHSAIRPAIAERSRATGDLAVRQQSFLARAAEVTERSPATAFSLFCAAGAFDAAERILAHNFSSIPLDATHAVRTLRQLPERVLSSHPTMAAALLLIEHSRPEVASSRIRFLLQLWHRGLARRLPSPHTRVPGPIDLQLVCQAMVANRLAGKLDAASRLMHRLEERLDLDTASAPSSNTLEADFVGMQHTPLGSLPTVYRELGSTALAVGDIPRARTMFLRLLRMTEQPNYWRDSPPAGTQEPSGAKLRRSWRLVAFAELALIEAIDGDLVTCSEWLQLLTSLAEAPGVSAPGTLWAGADLARAFLALESGDERPLEAASARLSVLGDRFEPWPLILVVQSAFIRRNRGAEAALTHLSSGLRVTQRISAPVQPWRGYVTTFEAMLNSSLGNTEHARALLSASPAEDTPYRLEHARRALFASQDVDAILIAESIGDPCATKRRRIDSRLIVATSAWGCGRHDEAIEAFHSAASLIEEYQLHSILLSVPYPQLRAVAEAARDSGARDLVAVVESIPRPARTARYEPLTAMEIQALAAISEHQHAGLAAESLFVTTGTVKKHLASVYRKLAVSDRDAAILKASRMGLLEQPDPGKR